ncbi:MAG: pantetheine-phosphate adenylyltransferase [Chloroflexi bacterium]|nr:pantetheine-phosphate adenylyltransferase [Chloroflexota bacterium]
MTTAIYPGRFDPVTLGHLDIIRRASQLFDRLVVSVFEAPEASTLFNNQERQDLIKEVTKDLKGVEVASFSGLVVDYAKATGAQTIVRGLRMNTDFEYEFEMALMNRKLSPDIDVVCLMTSLEYLYVRASLLKEVARLGGELSGLAPSNVIAALKQRYGN